MWQKSGKQKRMKNFHCTGDWNNVDFYHKMMAMDDNNQCNAIVFQTVWFRRTDMSGNDQEIRKDIENKYEVRFRVKFFDNFFKFIRKHRCLKENGHIVLPFHPRIIAGLFRRNAFGNNHWVMNLVKDVGVIGEIESNWQNVLKNKNAERANGYNHDDYKLSDDAFKAELEKQVKNMNVSPVHVETFLSNRNENPYDSKYITIKGKDLYDGILKAKENTESDDEDLFANPNNDGLSSASDHDESSTENENDNGNLNDDDNNNVKFEGQLSLTRNGDNNEEEPINAAIKVEAVVSANKEINLKIFLDKKIPFKRGQEEIQCNTVRVVDGKEGDSIDFTFDNERKCYMSPRHVAKRPRTGSESSVDAKRKILLSDTEHSNQSWALQV